MHPNRPRPPRLTRFAGLLAGTAAVALGAALAVPAAPAAASTPADGTRQADFAAAAARTGVPQALLLAVSYNESLWEAHHGAPSTTGDYGPMALTDVTSSVPDRGLTTGHTGTSMLATAAALTGATPQAVRTGDAANITAGAALLAQDARALHGGALPADLGGWYAAVARYSGAADTSGASAFADDVYSTLRTGAARRTDDGQALTLTAQPDARPDSTSLTALHLAAAPQAATTKPDCPATLKCTYIPAAYQQTDSNPGDYGNYDLADRPAKGLSINYIVIHDTEETYPNTVTDFQDPTHASSANYVVDGSNATVTQMVPNADVAWHAGNWYLNMHALGVEQVGFAVQGATWFTEKLYDTTATLVRYLAAKYHVTIDRQHIIGHDNVPGTSPATVPGMHWDPGPFWDWNHFMTLLGNAPASPKPGAAQPAVGSVVTVNPSFTGNIQTVTDCDGGTTVAPQASSFVYLRTAPSATAPLFNDPGLHPNSPAGTAGTTCASDWGDKVSAGQQFTVADRSGQWLAIWWDGAKVWFDNPTAHPVVAKSTAQRVRPKNGAAVATYGVAYPEASAFPAAIPAQTVTPLPYTIGAGQSYVYGGTTPDDYYYAKTIDNSIPDDHTDVPGTTKYLEIQLGHRIAFVKAADVTVGP